jgi:hypothetical protein
MAAVTKNRNFFNCPLLLIPKRNKLAEKNLTEKPRIYIKLLIAM